jgi:para-aminobenzoate synthetase/4-amino-4-deoxychorismate lyase
VIGRIRAGEVYQLNLCTRLTGELLVHPLELFVRTAAVTRPAYGAQLPTGPDTTLVSLSPERFLSVADGRVTTSPIKGTTKRSEDPDGSLLRSSAKDAAENIMITDLMRNDLSRVCVPGSVTVTGLLEIQPHPGVWHLVSTVTGDLVPGVGPADLLAATFPPGSVTGAPKSSAVRAIAAEERQPRGAYTGAAGLLTPDGRAELSVLIRTFEVSAGQVELGVGGGITVDSVPVREWQECLHKAEPLAGAAGSRLVEGLDGRPAPVPSGLLRHGVFETILAQHGRPLRLADHLARLARSVRELYGADLPADLVGRVREVAGTTGGVPRSAVRVHASPSGAGIDVSVTSRPLGTRLETCTLAPAIRSAVTWRHKWADRTELQAAEELTAPALPYVLDPAGRVAETSRGNLFVQAADGVWRTPPAGEHVLPGVTRRALLDELEARGVGDEISSSGAEALATARAAVWTSSLSGVVAVSELDRRRLDVDGTAASWTAWLGIG